MYAVRFDEFSERWAPTAIAVLRIVTALLFIEHGTAKLFGFPDSGMGSPDVWSLPWVAGWMEVVGGLMLLIGLFTRPVAFLAQDSRGGIHQFLGRSGDRLPISLDVNL